MFIGDNTEFIAVMRTSDISWRDEDAQCHVCVQVIYSHLQAVTITV
jgi:hypothetical protein